MKNKQRKLQKLCSCLGRMLILIRRCNRKAESKWY